MPPTARAGRSLRHWRPRFIVAANHTLERDEEIFVSVASGARNAAQLVGRDPTTDLAVLKVADLQIPHADFADLDSLRVGHLVLAIAAGELGTSASFGVLSALGAGWTTWRRGHIDRFIRADVDLYPGFSGGALVNAGGEVIGINTSGLSRRFDLTLSATTVNRVLDQLLDKGHVTRGYLGLGAPYERRLSSRSPRRTPPAGPASCCARECAAYCRSTSRSMKCVPRLPLQLVGFCRYMQTLWPAS